MYRMGLIVVLAACGTAALTGCKTTTTEVSHGELLPPGRPAHLTLPVGDLAEDRRFQPLSPPERIGRHTFSALGIPVGEVRAPGPLGEVVRPQVRQCLELSGYRVIEIDRKGSVKDARPDASPPSPASSPVLRGRIRKFEFTDYSWFWPIRAEPGQIEYELTLEDVRGEAIWSRRITARPGGSRYSEEIGFDPFIRRAMTDLLNQVIEAVSSDEFKLALIDARIASRAP